MKIRFIECMAAALIPFAVATLPTSSLATVNTIGQLNCSAGDVALFDGVNWVCSGQFNDFTADLEALEQALADETAAREAADTLLEQALSNEEAARIAGDTALQNLINDLGVDVDALAAALQQEVADRFAADVILQDQIDILNNLLGASCDDGEGMIGIDTDGNILCTEGAPPDPEGFCPCFSVDEINAIEVTFFDPQCTDIHDTDGVELFTEIEDGYGTPSTIHASVAGLDPSVPVEAYLCFFIVDDANIAIRYEFSGQDDFEKIFACRDIIRASDWWRENCPDGY